MLAAPLRRTVVTAFLTLLGCLATTSSAQAQSPFAERSWASPMQAWSTAVGPLNASRMSRPLQADFDGDKKSDFAAFYGNDPATNFSSQLIAWGSTSTNGRASVAAHSAQWSGSLDYTKLANPVAADFDGDGKADVAAIYLNGSTLQLMVWRATGSPGLVRFAAPTIEWSTSGWNPASVMPPVAGDFNGDGRADIATFYKYSGALGMFIWRSSYPATGTIDFDNDKSVWSSSGWSGDSVLNPVAGDFNRDGKADVGALYRYPGTEMRLFTWHSSSTASVMSMNSPQPVWYTNGWDGYRVQPPVAADFDGDGQADVAAIYRYDNNMAKMFVLRATSSAATTFVARERWYSPVYTWNASAGMPMTAGDIEGDGRANPSVFYRYNDTTVSLFSWLRYRTRPGADYTAENQTDLAWFHKENGGTVSLMPSFGTTLGHSGIWRSIVGMPDWAGTGDFNGDGRDDLAWFENASGNVDVMMSNGIQFSHNGTWRAGLGTPDWAGVGDFNGDGQEDLAWFNRNGGSLDVFTSSRDNTANGGTFNYKGTWKSGLANPLWAGVGDFNGDGTDDVAWFSGSTLSVMLSTETGFQNPVNWRTGVNKPDWAGVGDFDGDGKHDIGWYQAALGGNVVVFTSTGSSFGGGASWQGYLGNPDWAGTGDLNQDSRDDITWFHKNVRSIHALLSSGAAFSYNANWRGDVNLPDWAGAGDFAGDNAAPAFSTVTGALYTSRTAMTGGDVTINADDDVSGVRDIYLYEILADGTKRQLAETHRPCPMRKCRGTAFSLSHTVDPVALGWTTGAHNLVAEAWDDEGEVTPFPWTVQYYKNSWQYGGSNHKIDTSSERDATVQASTQAADLAAAQSFWDGVVSAEKTAINSYLDGSAAEDVVTDEVGTVQAPAPEDYAELGITESEVQADTARAASLSGPDSRDYGCRTITSKHKSRFLVSGILGLEKATSVLSTKFCFNKLTKKTALPGREEDRHFSFESKVPLWLQPLGYRAEERTDLYVKGLRREWNGSVIGEIAFSGAFDMKSCDPTGKLACVTTNYRFHANYGHWDGSRSSRVGNR